jgi:hypothetical protein
LNTKDWSAPAVDRADSEQPPGEGTDRAVLGFFLVVASGLYALLCWVAGSLYNHGQQEFAGLVGLAAPLPGIVAFFSLLWLVAPGMRRREGGLAKALTTFGFFLVVLGVPALAWYLTH